MRLFFMFTFIFFSASSSEAIFGMLGRDQCEYQQASYPTYQSDVRQAENTQLQGLQTQKQQMSARMAQLSSETLKVQGTIRGYIRTPWSETMLAHIDNGLDCCTKKAYSSYKPEVADRRPAGQDLPPPSDYETTTSYPVEPVPEDTPTYTAPDPQPESGQLCLQTGFAAEPDWLQKACWDGGKVNPEVCSNPEIVTSPSDYQLCVNALGNYYRLALERRQLASHIYECDANINKYSNNGSGGKGGGKGIGKFLGELVTTFAPLMLEKYLSYKAKKKSSNGPGYGMAKYGPPRPVTNVDGSGSGYYAGPSYGGSEYNNNYQPIAPAPPPYYGPQYGYGFNYGGNYGGTLPGYQQGGFGCSQGVLGTGTNLIGMLLGGGKGLNLNANIQSSFGPNGGYAPYGAYVNAYGNQYSGVPPSTFPGYMPPYQPGGIDGMTPIYRPADVRNDQAVPNYFTGYTNGSNYYSGSQPWNAPSYSAGLPYPNGQYPGANGQFHMNYQLGQIQNINADYNGAAYRGSPQLYYGNQNPANYSNSGYGGGLGGGKLLEALLGGGSAYINFNMRGY